MIVDVIMPKLGESITEGTILHWQKKVGEAIRKDESLLEIGTDKVDSEIPSPAAGLIIEVLFNPGDVVPVDQVIARIETEAKAGSGVTPRKKIPDKSVEIGQVTKIPEPVLPSYPVSPEQSFYTPLVRSIARKEGISEKELSTISGTGKGGRVTKKDMQIYLEKRQLAPGIAVPIVETAGEEIVEMGRIRQLIAANMRKSLDTAAHVHLVSECDVTGIVDFIRSREVDFQKQEGYKLTYTPFFILAAVKAIQDFPNFNTSVEDTRVIYKKNINIGLAVSTGSSLMVPVIPKCDELNFLGVCRKSRDITNRTRSGKIGTDELQGSTFSITNYGIFDNLFGTPIINLPNTSILGIGTVKKRPVVWELDAGDTIIIRSMVYLSLGFDHRLIDGSEGGQFLKRLTEYLENLDTSALL